jgi:hypothetical protein
MGGNKSPKARREELLQIVSRTAFHDFLRGLKPAKSGKATTPRHRRASRERSRGSLRVSTRRAK